MTDQKVEPDILDVDALSNHNDDTESNHSHKKRKKRAINDTVFPPEFEHEDLMVGINTAIGISLKLLIFSFFTLHLIVISCLIYCITILRFAL